MLRSDNAHGFGCKSAQGGCSGVRRGQTRNLKILIFHFPFSIFHFSFLIYAFNRHRDGKYCERSRQGVNDKSQIRKERRDVTSRKCERNGGTLNDKWQIENGKS